MKTLAIDTGPMGNTVSVELTEFELTALVPDARHGPGSFVRSGQHRRHLPMSHHDAGSRHRTPVGNNPYLCPAPRRAFFRSVGALGPARCHISFIQPVPIAFYLDRVSILRFGRFDNVCR